MHAWIRHLSPCRSLQPAMGSLNHSRVCGNTRVMCIGLWHEFLSTDSHFRSLQMHWIFCPYTCISLRTLYIHCVYVNRNEFAWVCDLHKMQSPVSPRSIDSGVLLCCVRFLHIYAPHSFGHFYPKWLVDVLATLLKGAMVSGGKLNPQFFLLLRACSVL